VGSSGAGRGHGGVWYEQQAPIPGGQSLERHDMLNERRVHATLPASDLARARAFYEGTLGFTPLAALPGGVIYRGGDGSVFTVFPTANRASGTHTQAGFTVTEIEREVAELKAKGVVFEEYDLPDYKTVGSIISFPQTRSAWFRDSEGNLLGLVQFTTPI
jgi:catechol 2,3-dioxygenase-like lactoylglutathione lyase family enzyme